MQAYMYATKFEQRLRDIVLWCYATSEERPRGRGKIIERFGDLVGWFHDQLVERRVRRSAP